MSTSITTTPAISTNTLILDDDDPAGAGRINDALADAGHDRLLGTPLPIGDGRLVVPLVRPGMDALDAMKLLDIEVPGHPARFEASLENGTVKPARGSLGAASKDIGHGSSFARITATTGDKPVWQPPPPGLRRPVVALLDTGVEDHDWLPIGGQSDDDPFLIDAEKVTGGEPWRPEPLLGNLVLHDGDDRVHEHGHGTFIAGLILAASPSTRILSIRVMNRQGNTRESVVNAGLCWLREYRRTHPVDVVCMAFGRRAGQTGDRQDLATMEGLLDGLAASGVQLVASAGNDHSDREVHPAAFGSVTAVGAGFGGYHAAFSNYGPWVDRYRDGVGVFGIFPQERGPGVWARWSGTSFAAAAFAGDLARPHVVG